MRALAIGCIVVVAACGGHHGAGDDAGDDTIDANGDDAPPPDAGPPTCTFHPPGQFNPGLECHWDGPSASAGYALYDDVVMTPVVINLTDDDGDGDVDLDDI